jgi:5-methylcytosine-specific restriction endonuclease McrA
MNKLELKKWIKELLTQGKIDDFYKSKYWRKLRKEVLKEQKEECQECLKLGKRTKANTVHHVQFVDKHPELALSKFYAYKGKQYRNLICVCPDCHNKLHPEKHKQKKELINEERW